MAATDSLSARRPLRSRQSGPARRAAAWLAARGVRPNLISLASVAFALLAGGALVAVRPVQGAAAEAALLAAAALCIQLRLVANLLDGMVAVEGGLGGRTGELFNDVPDRLADPVILVCAGYAAAVPELGWAAATLALLTAYVRVLGGSLGLRQDFSGPMAKQQRMALVTAACLIAAAVCAIDGYREGPLAVALGLVVAGAAVTCARRLRRIAVGLEAR